MFYPFLFVAFLFTKEPFTSWHGSMRILPPCRTVICFRRWRIKWRRILPPIRNRREQKIIRLGIGDVTLPLAPVVVEAMQKAAAEMGVKETFRGYGPEQGYGFLQEALVKYYAGFGVTLKTSEVFISDGAKSDCGNITDIFDDANVILVPDPVYPVYLDTNRMRGRKIRFMEGTPENGFLPMPDPAVKADIIYLCSPNNPTGAAYSKAQLKETGWLMRAAIMR